MASQLISVGDIQPGPSLYASAQLADHETSIYEAVLKLVQQANL